MILSFLPASRSHRAPVLCGLCILVGEDRSAVRRSVQVSRFPFCDELSTNARLLLSDFVALSFHRVAFKDRLTDIEVDIDISPEP